MSLSLDDLGWGEDFAAGFAALGEDAVVPARVIFEHGRFYRVAGAEGEAQAALTGRVSHQSANAAALPTVGDWVAVRPAARAQEWASIRGILPRRSKFSRRGAGKVSFEQVVAANVDTVFIMMGLDADYNVRRFERYLAVAHASGARPIVLLNKADLTDDATGRMAEVQALAGTVPVVSLSLLNPTGHQILSGFLEPRRTIALLGSSGVGKSTLTNRLLGQDVQKAAPVRLHDSRGRHTTTRAQLFGLPGGALVIDTPGLRELQLWDADEGIEAAFSDVEAFASECRFRDCSHQNEPGCAVRAAVAGGTLADDRFASYGKLRAEATAASARESADGHRKRKAHSKVMTKALKKHYKDG